MNKIETVNHCIALLKDNTEWIGRFNKYACKVTKHVRQYNVNRKKFRVTPPLYKYSCISSAEAGTEFDLRFYGQSVGKVKVSGNNITLNTKAQPMPSGEPYFDWEPSKLGQHCDWHSIHATAFRQHFKNLTEWKSKSPEHSIENQLLAEFSKKKSINKALCNIQPIRLSGCFFQMPSPFRASKSDDIVYPKNGNGGGIDILARVKHCNNESRLCICELKDENKPSEPQAKAIKQAIAYATFIATLLNTPKASNDKWWNLFGFSKEIPTPLNIDVVTIMPYNGHDDLDGEETIEVGDYASLHIYSLFFDKNDDWTFSGTLVEALKR